MSNFNPKMNRPEGEPVPFNANVPKPMIKALHKANKSKMEQRVDKSKNQKPTSPYNLGI